MGLYNPWENPWDSPGQNTGVGSLSLLQGIFPTQGSNPGLPHCRWILNQLSYQGSPASGKELAYICRRHKETWAQSLGQEDPLEKGMATHSSILS